MSTDIMLRRIASSIFAAQQDAARAFEAGLAEKAKAILGAVPYDGLGGKQQRPPECMCDGLLVDLSGKNHDVSRAMIQSGQYARKLDLIFTRSGLTPVERTVMVRRYMDKMDNRMINAADGYTDADALIKAALEKINRTMEKEAGMEL